MSDTVIKVDSLSKAYKIGLKERQGRTFREAVLDTAAAPFRRLASLATGGNGHGGNQETFWALKDVSFEVKRGEVVGIIGRNGAGKSTLLKILSQITEPTSGEVRMKGRVASLLEVGTGFHPELTGRENIYLNGAILGMKRTEITRKFDEIVAFAEVEKFLDTPVKHYSSGMYVRLAFAVAAHLEPEILIVDEVLAVGDAEFQKKCLGKMKEVSEGNGRTVLFVSHNMAAVRGLCSKAAFLDGGRARGSGGVDEILRLYARTRESIPEEVGVGCGEFEIVGFEFSGEEGRGLFTFQPARIAVLLRARSDCPEIGVHAFIEDDTGYLVAGLDSRAVGLSRGAVAGGLAEVCFRIGNLPLLPGQYRVRIVVRNDRTFKASEADRVFVAEVQESAVYGSTRLQRHLHGCVAMDIEKMGAHR